jgi:hypothetical protein
MEVGKTYAADFGNGEIVYLGYYYGNNLFTRATLREVAPKGNNVPPIPNIGRNNNIGNNNIRNNNIKVGGSRNRKRKTRKH